MPSLTLTHVPITGSVHVYLNGVEQYEVTDWLFSTSANRIDTLPAMDAQPADLLEVRYSHNGVAYEEAIRTDGAWHVVGEDTTKWVTTFPPPTFSSPGEIAIVKPSAAYRWLIMRQRIDGGAWDAGGWAGNAFSITTFPLTEYIWPFGNFAPVNPMNGHQVEYELGWSTKGTSPATWDDGMASGGVTLGILRIWRDL